MRIAPILIPHLKSPSTELWTDAILAAMLTHNDASSVAAGVAFINILWHLLNSRVAPDPIRWLETYVQVAKGLEGDTTYRPRSPHFANYEGPVWRFVYEEVQKAYDADTSILDACNLWHSGAYLIETMPSVVYILMRHGDNLEEAIVRSVNDTKDNDTVAAIVGAAMGALHGKERIPDRWISNLSGRTTNKDDGRVFELIAQAEKTFWNQEVRSNQ
jgi:ADP-ribosylglycohydrolase